MPKGSLSHHTLADIEAELNQLQEQTLKRAEDKVYKLLSDDNDISQNFPHCEGLPNHTFTKSVQLTQMELNALSTSFRIVIIPKKITVTLENATLHAAIIRVEEGGTLRLVNSSIKCMRFMSDHGSLLLFDNPRNQDLKLCAQETIILGGKLISEPLKKSEPVNYWLVAKDIDITTTAEIYISTSRGRICFHAKNLVNKGKIIAPNSFYQADCSMLNFGTARHQKAIAQVISFLNLGEIDSFEFEIKALVGCSFNTIKSYQPRIEIIFKGPFYTSHSLPTISDILRLSTIKNICMQGISYFFPSSTSSVFLMTKILSSLKYLPELIEKYQDNTLGWSELLPLMTSLFRVALDLSDKNKNVLQGANNIFTELLKQAQSETPFSAVNLESVKVATKEIAVGTCYALCPTTDITAFIDFNGVLSIPYPQFGNVRENNAISYNGNLQVSPYFSSRSRFKYNQGHIYSICFEVTSRSFINDDVLLTAGPATVYCGGFHGGEGSVTVFGSKSTIIVGDLTKPPYMYLDGLAKYVTDRELAYTENSNNLQILGQLKLINHQPIVIPANPIRKCSFHFIAPSVAVTAHINIPRDFIIETTKESLMPGAPIEAENVKLTSAKHLLISYSVQAKQNLEAKAQGFLNRSEFRGGNVTSIRAKDVLNYATEKQEAILAGRKFLRIHANNVHNISHHSFLKTTQAKMIGGDEYGIWVDAKKCVFASACFEGGRIVITGNDGVFFQAYSHHRTKHWVKENIIGSKKEYTETWTEVSYNELRVNYKKSDHAHPNSILDSDTKDPYAGKILIFSKNGPIHVGASHFHSTMGTWLEGLSYCIYGTPTLATKEINKSHGFGLKKSYYASNHQGMAGCKIINDSSNGVTRLYAVNSAILEAPAIFAPGKTSIRGSKVILSAASECFEIKEIKKGLYFDFPFGLGSKRSLSVPPFVNSIQSIKGKNALVNAASASLEALEVTNALRLANSQGRLAPEIMKRGVSNLLEVSAGIKRTSIETRGESRKGEIATNHLEIKADEIINIGVAIQADQGSLEAPQITISGGAPLRFETKISDKRLALSLTPFDLVGSAQWSNAYIRQITPHIQHMRVKKLKVKADSLQLNNAYIEIGNEHDVEVDKMVVSSSSQLSESKAKGRLVSTTGAIVSYRNNQFEQKIIPSGLFSTMPINSENFRIRKELDLHSGQMVSTKEVDLSAVPKITSQSLKEERKQTSSSTTLTLNLLKLNSMHISEMITGFQLQSIRHHTTRLHRSVIQSGANDVTISAANSAVELALSIRNSSQVLSRKEYNLNLHIPNIGEFTKQIACWRQQVFGDTGVTSFQFEEIKSKEYSSGRSLSQRTASQDDEYSSATRTAENKYVISAAPAHSSENANTNNVELNKENEDAGKNSNSNQKVSVLAGTADMILQNPAFDSSDNHNQTVYLTKPEFVEWFIGYSPKKKSTLYRGDGRSSTIIFGEGFKASGTNMNILDHVLCEAIGSDKASGFISTSNSMEAAIRYPRCPQGPYTWAPQSSPYPYTYIYLYAISRPDKGTVDVNRALKPLAGTEKLSFEKYKGYFKDYEVSVQDKIPPEMIEGAWRVKVFIGEKSEMGNVYHRGKLQEFISNPGYSPTGFHSEVSLKHSLGFLGLIATTTDIVVDSANFYNALLESNKANHYQPAYKEATRIVGAWSGANVAAAWISNVSNFYCKFLPLYPSIICRSASSLLASSLGYNAVSEMVEKNYDEITSRVNFSSGISRQNIFNTQHRPMPGSMPITLQDAKTMSSSRR